MKKEISSSKRKGCGCGKRALKVVRKLGISQEEMSDAYVEKHHARATAQALFRMLTGRK